MKVVVLKPSPPNHPYDEPDVGEFARPSNLSESLYSAMGFVNSVAVYTPFKHVATTSVFAPYAVILWLETKLPIGMLISNVTDESLQVDGTLTLPTMLLNGALRETDVLGPLGSAVTSSYGVLMDRKG